MIRLTRMNGNPFVVNSELIQFVDSAPDTVLTLRGGEKLMVRECVDDVVRLTLEFKQSVAMTSASGDPALGAGLGGASERPRASALLREESAWT